MDRERNGHQAAIPSIKSSHNSGSVMDFSSGCGEGDSIKIFLRVRPPGSNISENDFAPKVLDVNTQENAIILRTKPEPKIFTYDNVGDADITQEALFTIVGKKIIESCVAGYNGTIFAYGQTGSGKTFTMLGPAENSESFQHELRGVIPRSFEYLFNLIAHQRELHGSKKQFLCRCSFLEIYQEQIFDLLDPTSQGLHLRENMNKGVFVDGLVEEVIDNPSEAYQVLITGWLNRRVAATSMNRESSRSHAVFTVTIESKEDEGGIQNIRTSQLNLVDLAGSERQKDTNTGGTRLKEAGSINKSLSVLGNVIMSLVEVSNGKKRHVPYRDSKLTFLLRDSLGGNTKTRMIACVHPDSKCFQESLSTLNFARSAKLIKNKAVVNEDFHGSNLKLQNEIRRLKEQLDILHTNEPMQSMSMSVEVPAAVMNSDSVWKKKFIEAMHFRDVSESEKKTLQDVVNHLQELCNKKDKYIQSTKMIIKFRENNIQTLQNAVHGYEDVEKDSLVKSLRGEIKVLQQQLENNPALARIAGQNKYLQSELKRLRSQSSVISVISDDARIAELERVFAELKLFNDMSSGKNTVPATRSPQKEVNNTVLIEKHRKEIKSYQEQIEQLKQQVLEVTKQAENRQMEMEVELVSSRKMISELERMLEAHQIKSRIECNALKNLHCQTLKVMTTPTTPTRSIKPESQATPEGRDVATSSPCTPENCLPPVLAEGAHDALMEEIQSLTSENGKLKENVDEYEAVMLRTNQKVEKLEHYNSQLNGVLEKERTETTLRNNDHKTAVNTLKEEIENVKKELKLLNDENSDLYLVLKSTDRQLKEEKERLRNLQAKHGKESEVMQLRMSSVTMDFQNTTKEFEEALKELSTAKEELETNRLTVNFLENQSLELETRMNQEIKLREKVEMDYDILRGESSMSSQSYAEFKQKAEISLKQKQAELERVKEEQEKVIAEQNNMLDQNKEAIGSLVNKLQDMKTKQSHQEEFQASLSSDCDRYMQEVRELKRELDLTSGELSAVQKELREGRENYEQQLMAKDFEIDNLQQDQDSMNNHLLRKDEIINSLQGKVTLKDKLCKDMQETVESYKQKLSDTERSMQEKITQYEKKLFEIVSLDGNPELLQSMVQDKNGEVESLRLNYQKLNSVIRDYEQSRKEKNNVNELLKAQVMDLEKSNATLQIEKQDLQVSHESLLAETDKNKEHVRSLESRLCNLEEELKLEQDEKREAEVGQMTWQEKWTELKTQLVNTDKEQIHVRQEVHRLQASLEAQYAEKSDLHSKIECLTEEKSKLANEYQILRQRNLQLEEDSSKLIGHNNHSQKIKLMDKKNQEYNELFKSLKGPRIQKLSIDQAIEHVQMTDDEDGNEESGYLNDYPECSDLDDSEIEKFEKLQLENRSLREKLPTSGVQGSRTPANKKTSELCGKSPIMKDVTSGM